MKETAVEWAINEIQSNWYDYEYGDLHIRDVIKQAKAMEREQMIYIIKTYHNNLFYLPLSENGEADRILDLILTKQIKPKL